MKFTYYTMIGKDLDLLRGHVDNIKGYAGFDALNCEKEFLVIVYRNNKIPLSTTNKLLEYCVSKSIRTVIYDEPTDSFLDNLYACWNLGYEKATDGYVFRSGSDQVFSKDSFISLYNMAESLRLEHPYEKTILQANTIEDMTRINLTGTRTRHFCEDFGFTFESFNYKKFEEFNTKINAGMPELIDINTALHSWGHPTVLQTSIGVVNRVDGCSWLMTKDDFDKVGPMPPLQRGITGDVIIHDRLQLAGYKEYIVRDCITYHFVMGERVPIQ